MLTLAHAIGGLVLFLLGMLIMTDALPALAGAQIRSALMRFTRSPSSGVLAGATATAILQSSSATTVAAVGLSVPMQRLFERCEVDKHRAGVACQTTEMLQHINAFKTALKKIVDCIAMAAWQEANRWANESFKLISGDANSLRRKITSKIAQGSINLPAGVDSLKAVRWLRRISIHVLMITHYQSNAQEYLAKA